jgi:hypothetical protein
MRAQATGFVERENPEVVPYSDKAAHMPMRDTAPGTTWLGLALDRRLLEDLSEPDAPIAPFNSSL